MKNTILKIGACAFTPKREMIETLFQPINGKTAAGYYVKKSHGVQFHTPNGQPWFFLVANRHGERFFVSCGTVNGRTFYMHALSGSDENRLGIAGLKYSEEISIAEALWNQLS